MPSTLPSTFASAAAGQSRGSRSGAMEGGNGSGGGDWRDGRAPSTRTFRRPTTATSNNQNQQQAETATHGLAQDSPQVPSSLTSPPDASMRYSKSQMLAISKARESGAQHRGPVESLFSALRSSQTNGNTSRGWGKNDAHSAPDSETCLNLAGHSPIGNQDMTEAEKELFIDVNSPLKQQPQKDTAQGGANGRKASVSQGANYPLSSPSTASRPSTRRRETTDTNPFSGGGGLVSPTASGRFRDESWLGRKASDLKDAAPEAPEEDMTPPSASIRPGGFGALLRSNTSGSTGFAAPSSPWNTATGPATSTAGTFGSFALSSGASDKRFAGSRGESRFAHLIPKDSAENTPGKIGDAVATDIGASWRSRQRTDTDPFATEDQPIGSKVLGVEEPLQYRNVSQHSHMFETPVKGSVGDFGLAGLNLGGHVEPNVGDTPETNPYRSPGGDHGEVDQRQPGVEKIHTGPFGQESFAGMSSFARGFSANLDASDRSQTSSVGAKGFSSVNPLGTWPSNFMTSTPDRERPSYGAAFGTSLFSGDLQSPAFGGMPGVFGPGGGGSIGATGSIKGSKMNALFPTSMHTKVQTPDQDTLGDSIPDHRHANPLGAIGRGSIGLSTREPENPIRPGRSTVDDFFSDTRSPTMFGNPEQPYQAAPLHGDIGQAQTKSMVMPDRMRWHYLDPQGERQGPFTGLEMNDWYKANFFTPDLRVKKLEDDEFEPLGQLIRRIGNSREPFLVPQMGVPHGEPSPSGPFAAGGGGDRGVIPPLMGAFPSFGRTLTADEQNNLERRKQEEQQMQARQRELLVAQHGYPKMQMPLSGATVPLHHHSSAQSLHSQPSFGSITSPMTSQGPMGVLGQSAGFFDQPSRMAQPPRQPGLTSAEDYISDDLNTQEREMLASLQQQQPPAMSQPGIYPSAIAAPVSDQPTRGQLPALNELEPDTQGFSERLKEFRALRAQREAEEMSGMAPQAEQPRNGSERMWEELADIEDIMKQGAEHTQGMSSRALSLTQQVQNTQAAAEAAKLHAAQETWETTVATPDSSMPMPFPPPVEQANAPLPAPTAQRTRSTLPDQYAASRSQSETPESTATGSAVQPPPLAPWARDPGADGHRGPSLKEIQEAEAKKAAKAEEIAAAARRAAAEQEAAAQRERERAGLTVAPGLPTTSTWGNGTPVTTSSSSAWAKPSPVSSSVPGPPSGAATLSADKKRTIADIQREEEKQKQKQTQKRPAQQAGTVSVGGMGTRYADLAGKAQAPSKVNLTSTTPVAGPSSSMAPPPGSGWNVVGAGGKPRVGSVPAAPPTVRSVSASGVKPTSQSAIRPVVKQSTGITRADSGSAAAEEVKKWLHRELARGISMGVDINNTVSLIMAMSLDDPSGIEDVVYGVTKTINARHLVQELVRRRRLAEKGIILDQQPGASAATDSKGSGWNEVAKKGGNPTPKEENNSMPAGFKVVPGRKKGKK